MEKQVEVSQASLLLLLGLHQGSTSSPYHLMDELTRSFRDGIPWQITELVQL